MTLRLKDKVIAALVTSGLEENEFVGPTSALADDGARIVVVAPNDGEIRAWNKNQWGRTFRVDKHLNSALCIDFDALLLPSAISCRDTLPINGLAINDSAVKFVGDFIKMKKPVAAICHAPILLAKTGLLKGRTVTSHVSVRPDLRNAGAEWLNHEVVVDRELITSSGPSDMSLFNSTMVQAFCDEMREYHWVGWGT